MVNPNSDTAVVDFWRWASDKFSHCNLHDFIGELDDRLLQLGPISWEIGESSKEGVRYFAVSPDLNVDCMKIVLNIVEKAPLIENWIVIPYKQPKQDFNNFEIVDRFGRCADVIIADWRFILYEFEKGIFELDVLIDDLEKMSDTIDADAVLDVALLSIIGEEVIMKHIESYFLKCIDPNRPTRGMNYAHLQKFFIDRGFLKFP